MFVSSVYEYTDANVMSPAAGVTVHTYMNLVAEDRVFVIFSPPVLCVFMVGRIDMPRGQNILLRFSVVRWYKFCDLPDGRKMYI